MPTIHPTAIVESSVQLADDVVVGPSCVITGEVRVGPGTRFIGHCYVQGPVTIGSRNVFYPFACVGFEPQYLNDKGKTAGVVIGDDNVLRESATIHRSITDTPTTIGNSNMLMVNTHLGHDVVMGNRCILANGALIAGHVEISDNAIFGGNAVVHQFCRVGRMAMMAGVAGVSRDVPPFCTVYRTRYVGGLNLVGLRRAGFRDSIRPLKRAFDLLFLQNHAMPKALELIEQTLGDNPLCMELVRFCRATKRGICTYNMAGNGETDSE